MSVKNTGEIRINDPFGPWIAKYAADTRYSRYLEIGTWDGRGSTCCFYEGFKTRSDSFTLQSYEVVKERADAAKRNWSFCPKIEVINGRVLKDNECPLYTEVVKIHSNVNEAWHQSDVVHFWKCPFVEPNDPEVILLDGGEYFTYFEFKNLIKTTNASVYLMDDTNSKKCSKIVEWFELSPGWSCVASGTHRNGWAVYEKSSFFQMRYMHPRGRLCNHIIRNICISLVAEKNDIKFTYEYANEIERLGIRLFSGSRVFDNDIVINDNNFFELLSKPVESNLIEDGYFQTKEITNYIYQYLRKEDVRASIIKTNQFSHLTGKNENVFVHIRLGDVPHLNPGVNYYDSILSKLPFKVGYLASDSPTHEICNQLVEKHRLNVLSLDEVDTLKFGSTCKYIILSGGTFSSCIGYLAYDSIVYYPRRDLLEAWHGDIFSISGWIENDIII